MRCFARFWRRLCFVEVPHYHNKLEEADTENEKKRKANKKRHKDIDARWTKKGGEKHYGYKNHTKADAKSKLIKKCVTTAAKEHDSSPSGNLWTKATLVRIFLATAHVWGKE